MDAATGLLGSIRQSYDAQAFNKVLDKIWQVVGDANRYVDDMAPWALKKTDPDRMATSLYVLADTIRVLGVLMQPIVPESASKMLDQLALGDEDRKFAALETRLVPGTELPKPSPVFPRYVEPDVTEARVNPPAIVDSHCHLDFETFEEERDEVIERARRAGVCRMVTISTWITTFPKIRTIAERYDDVFCSVGIHPHQAGEEPEISVAELTALAAHPKVVGIGESGFDYFYDNSPRTAQRRSFITHIRAAQETGLPLIVHARDADADTADLLESEYARKPYTGVLHCFSSGRRLAERALDIGFYISLSGIITFKSADDIRATIRDVPLTRLLVETDFHISRPSSSAARGTSQPMSPISIRPWLRCAAYRSRKWRRRRRETSFICSQGSLCPTMSPSRVRSDPGHEDHHARMWFVFRRSRSR